MNVAFIASMFLALGSTQAQNHNLEPVPELKNLDFLTGDWKGEQNFNTQGGPPMVGKLTLHTHRAVSGHYIEEHSITQIPGRPEADVRHYITYDKKTDKYRAWWFNDTKVGPSEYVGGLEGDKFVLESVNKPTLRATYEKVSAKKYNYKLEMKQDNGWMELFHSTYTKR